MVHHLRAFAVVLLGLTCLIHSVLSAEYTTTGTATPHDNLQNCSCYVVNSGADSNTPAYFQYYRFYDFRNLASGPGQFLQAPPEINDTQDAGEEDVWDEDILNSDAWNTDWGIQNWSKPSTEEFPTRMVNSPANIYLLQNDDDDDPFTYLTLRTNRLDDFQSAAEIENLQKNMMHVSMRMHARVVGQKGAVAGFFTFFDDDNESDIEILTNDAPDTIRYTNQPAVDKEGNEVAAASLAPDALAPWDDWQTHRIDWLDKNSYWFLNNEQVAANTYSVPRKPSGMVVNMWSDGGEWSGNMSVGTSAEFQIQWIEMTFNTSGPVEGAPGGNKKRGIPTREGLGKRDEQKGCEVVCKIDDVKKTGTPEIVSVNKSMAPGIPSSSGLVGVVGCLSILIALFS